MKRKKEKIRLKIYYYFKYDERTKNLKSSSKVIDGKGIDIKADGGQVVFFCSIHPDTGKPYQLVRGGEIASMPDWLFKALTSKDKGKEEVSVQRTNKSSSSKSSSSKSSSSKAKQSLGEITVEEATS